MEQLQNTFYIIGIIYMIINILLLLGIGIGIYFVAKAVMDIHKQVSLKIKEVEYIIQHPEEKLAEVGTSILKASLRNVKKVFQKNKEDNAA